MRPVHLRILGILATACVLLGAGLATIKLEVRGQKVARARAAQAGGKALSGAREALIGRLREVEARAAAGASLNPVRALVAEHVDTATLQDAFGTETWWQSFRDEFTLHSLIGGRRRFDFTPDGAARSVNLSALLTAVEGRPLASSLLLAGDVPHLAAAAQVQVPTAVSGRALLVLARPLEAAELEAIAQESRATLFLVNAKGAPLMRAGVLPSKEMPSPTLDGTPLIGPKGNWFLARAEVGPGLFLWARADTRVEAAQVRREVRALMVPVWFTALLASGVALWLGLRPQREKATEELLAQTTERLAEAEAQIKRLSRSMPTVQVLTDTSPPPPLRSRIEPSLTAPVPFGRYELLRPLGEGGMARVYLALARSAGGFERLFVIKRLHEPLTRQPDAVAQFMDEARLGASLIHSNVIPVYDFGQVDGEYYLASEYILGRDLDAVVRRSFEVDSRPLEPATVFFVAQEVLKALGYAHTRQDAQGRPLRIVHRDVSPMNILASGRGEVKLLDFGIAKSAHSSAHTRAGLVKGNVNFISPEQARGLEVDGRADLFSLGLTLFWCLTGELLYGDGQNDFDRLIQAAEGPNEAHWERIAQLPAPAAAILQRVLQPHPADRFRSAEEFALALPAVRPEDTAGLGRTMLRLFGEELRAESAYRSALAAVSVSPSSLGHAFTG